ncbi:LVIVD repeat-containing protein [Myxococcus faecalis]|uniref:LVIVD repeat-containing protein n=1 Tax=Myxococcus faecalis TaxID=3115646 RepID=UPI003CF595BB
MVKRIVGAVVMLWCAGASTACQGRDDEVVELPVDLSPGPAIQDRADWEPVPLAACKLKPGMEQLPACGTLESFDLSGCDTESLRGLDRSGGYNLRFHGADIAADDTAQYIGVDHFAPLALGRRGALPLTRGADDHLLYSVYRETRPNRPALVMATVGCSAQARDHVKGCAVSCLAGHAPVVDTWEGRRVQWLPGEAESSGGLELLGEAGGHSGRAVDVFVAREHAYVVSIDDYFLGAGALQVYDVKDRQAPRLVKTVQFADDSYWNGVWAKGEALYIASAARGVLVFDITDPANPLFLRDLSGGAYTNVHTLFVDGDRLYSMVNAPDSEVHIHDVKNPREPVLLGHYRDSTVGVVRGSFPHDATSLNHRLFVSHWRGGLVILDAKDPANVKRLGAYVYPRATSHASRVAYFNNNLIAFEGGEDWGAHLRVLNLNDPANPTLIGEYQLPAWASIHNMELKGSRLYLAHYQHGLRVLDVSKPREPRPLGHFHTVRESDPNRGLDFWDGAIGIRLPGDGYVYVVDTTRGLLIFPEI